MRHLFLVLLVFLSGCYAPENSGIEIINGRLSCEASNMKEFTPLQWGNSRKIQPADWQENRPLTIVTKDAEFEREHRETKRPFTKNLTLNVDIPSGIRGNFALRWLVGIGVGGAYTEFLVDAAGLSQITVSADQLRVSLVAQSPGSLSGVSFSAPTLPIEAQVFYCEGTTETDSATYTELVALPASGVAGSLVAKSIPKGASSFRILGDPASITTPFHSTMSYALISVDGSTVLDAYTGDELFGMRLAPIPTGEAGALQLHNTDLANGANFSIEWELDF